MNFFEGFVICMHSDGRKPSKVIYLAKKNICQSWRLKIWNTEGFSFDGTLVSWATESVNRLFLTFRDWGRTGLLH
jgi:hypothetical protein